MDRIDPDTLLDWLSSGHGCDLDNRLMQRDALERLCEVLLFSDNVDRCFEMWSPRVFLPALCRIFLDESAPEEILEIAARAITYFLDVSHDCSRRIVQVDGAVKAICTRLLVADMSDYCSKELAQQCIKIIEGICQREHAAVYEAGGLQCLLAFVKAHGAQCHLDVTHSAMNAATRLCTRVEPSDDSLPTSVDCLQYLLEHQDSGVVDITLRCLATLVDRFAKRHADPAPLAPEGVLSMLLKQLRRRSERNFTAVTAVLTSLCKASPEVAQALLLRQDLDLPDALIEALKLSASSGGEDRIALESLRLSELLMTLVFEGRPALVQLSGSSVVAAALGGLRGASGGGAGGGASGSAERPHRQLIDAIRSKDTETVVDAIESGAFDVNYMDDVGQTLLNWAAAFGTKEMVKFLCSRGADVNFGKRSSSLHYAACFGRPEIVKLLLKYGADPTLKDEENKLPIDKARERQDAGHREVISILTSPREYMSPAGSTAAAAAAAENAAVGDPDDSEDAPSSANASNGTAGYPECRPAFMHRFAPALLGLYWDSMAPSIRRCAIHLLLKLLSYADADFLASLGGSELASGLVQLVAHALQDEQSDIGQRNAALRIAEQFSSGWVPLLRFGLMHEAHLREKAREKRAAKEQAKEQLKQAQSASAGSNSTESSKTAAVTPAVFYQPTQQELEQHRLYQWFDWSLARTRESLFLFGRHCAIELPNMSNGWFKYQLDSRVCTMYSSGSAESESPQRSQHQRETAMQQQDDFSRRLQSVKALALRHHRSGSQKLAEFQAEVGKWQLTASGSELRVCNRDGGTQTTVLRPGLAGFEFETSRKTHLKYVSEHQSQSSQQQQPSQHQPNCNSLASALFLRHLQDVDAAQTGVCDKLRAVGRALAATPNQPHQLAAGEPPSTGSSGVINESGVVELVQLFDHEATVSAYELHTSGLLPALLMYLHSEDRQNSDGLVDLTGRQLRVEPLCSVGELEQYLLKRVCKQWHDLDRSTFRMFQAFPDGAVQLTYAYDFDENGLFYWLGTNAGSQPSWVNPVQAGVVVMTTWNGKDLSYGKLEHFLSRDHAPLNCHTADDRQAAVDLLPSAYTIRHARGFSRSALRNWVLEASHDATNWIVISKHVNDEGLRDPGSTCTWPIELADLRSATAHDLETDDGAAAAGCSRGWRYFQIRVTGKNASNQMHVLSCSGLELYGRVTRAHAEVGAALRAREQQLAKARRRIRDHALNQLVPGARVVRGPDWCWGSQDSLGEGTVTKELTGGKVAVRWDAKPDQIRVYRMQKRDNVYDLTLAPSHDEQQVRQYNLTQRKSNSSPALDFSGPSSAGGGSNSGSSAALNEAEKFEDEERWLSEVLDRGDLSLLKNMEDLMMRGSSAGAGRSAVMGVADHLTASDPNLDSDAAATSAGSAAAGSASASAPSSAASTTSRAGAAAAAAANASSPGDFSDFFNNFAAAVRSSMRRHNQHQMQQSAAQYHHLMHGSGARGSNSSASASAAAAAASAAAGSRTPDLRRQYARLWSHARHRGGGGGGSGGGGGGGGHTGASVGGGGSSEPPPDSTQSFPNLPTASETSPKQRSDSQQQQQQSQAPNPLPQVGRRQRRKSGSGSGGSSSAAAAVSGTATTVVLSDSDSDMMQLCSAHHPDDEFLDYHEDDATATAAAASAGMDVDVDFPPPEVVAAIVGGGGGGGGRQPWDDELIVKRQCPALLPAFDPVPGRTNVNQTQDFHIGDPSPASMDKLMSLMLPQSAAESDNAPSNSTKLVLSVKSVQHTDLELTMQDRSASVFKYIVQAMLEASLRSSATAGSAASRGNGAAISDQLRRVWDTSFTLAYREADAAEGSLSDSRSPAAAAAVKGAERDSTGSEARLLSRSAPSDVGRSPEEMTPAQVEQSLHRGSLHKSQVLDYIAASASEDFMREWRLRGSRRNVMRKNNCRKLISAYRQLLKDQTASAASPAERQRRRRRTASLRLASESEPLTADTAGVEDALNLLHIFYTANAVPAELFHSKKLTQKLTRQAQEPLMLASLALPDWCESVANYCPILFPFSLRLQLFHCVAFGPTRALMWIQAQKRRAQELQQGQTKRPVREDQLPLGEVDLGRLKRERVRIPRLSGDPLLAWAAQLLDTHAARKAELEVQFDGEQGTGLGPTLEFFSLLAAEFTRRDLGMWICEDPNADEAEDAVAEDGKPVGYYVTRPSGLFPAPYRTCPPRVAALFRLLGMSLAKCLQDGRLMDVSLSTPLLRLLCQAQEPGDRDSSAAWWSGILGSQDFACLYPERASLINRLESEPDRAAVAAELEDLCLDCVWLPTSRVPSGSRPLATLFEASPEPVTLSNLAEFAALTRQYALDTGLRAQLEALKNGFDSVFPMHRLRLFTPEELRSLLCGEQAPEWTREDILEHTEPKNGYHRDHPTVLMLADVLTEFNPAERKQFLQFATGCSSLPPGGLRNLHPRLTIVRKHDSSDGSYPSVNTCLHYLKLPEYSCSAVMRDRILVATLEKGFHLN
uniref:E3 ubiquitin-protein ligase n=1 Tax=Macrostomum lignano TaxID=282301 RepID=A0A1I8GC05_9PLAT